MKQSVVPYFQVTIFQKMTTGEEGEGMPTEDYTVTVMGVLSTLETILALVEEHPEILKRVEHVVRTAVVQIFESFASGRGTLCVSSNIIKISVDFFEEALSLTQTLIGAEVSPEMWDVYRMIYQTFCQEGAGFFSGMSAYHAFHYQPSVQRACPHSTRTSSLIQRRSSLCPSALSGCWKCARRPCRIWTRKVARRTTSTRQSYSSVSCCSVRVVWTNTSSR